MYASLAPLLIPLASTLAIVLNVYNGDVLGIQENLEYLLWHAVPLGIELVRSPTRKTLAQNHILILGGACNIFWYYESPFRKDKGIRHRTEYYDTQALLCALLYHSCYERWRALTSA